MSTNLLEVNHLGLDLSMSRGMVRVLHDVSFAIQAGQSMGIVGESGCGKSLTALSLLGLQPEEAKLTGQISLLGQEIANLPDDKMRRLRGRRIGMVFQEPMTALNPVHTIGRQVAEPLRIHFGMSAKQAKVQAIEMLERVGIDAATSRFDAYPHQFSGGQRQRIVLAMALIAQPQLLIADEPTTALDVHVASQMLQLLHDLTSERQMGLILISHNLNVIANHTDQMMVMYAGRVIEQGKTQDVFRHPGHPYTLGLMAARPRLGATRGKRLPTVPGGVPSLWDLPAGCAFSDRCRFVDASCQAKDPSPYLWGQQWVRCHRVGWVHE